MRRAYGRSRLLETELISTTSPNHLRRSVDVDLLLDNPHVAKVRI